MINDKLATVDLIKLKSVDHTKVYDISKVKGTNWQSKYAKRLRPADEDEKGVFWLDFEEFCDLFDHALVCHVQDGYNQFSCLRKGKDGAASVMKNEV